MPKGSTCGRPGLTWGDLWKNRLVEQNPKVVSVVTQQHQLMPAVL